MGALKSSAARDELRFDFTFVAGKMSERAGRVLTVSGSAVRRCVLPP